MVDIVLWSVGDWRHSSDETKASGRAVVKKEVAPGNEVREQLGANQARGLSSPRCLEGLAKPSSIRPLEIAGPTPDIYRRATTLAAAGIH